MCKCNKGLPANRTPIISGAFAVSNGNFRYNNSDFVTKYYVAQSGQYIGSSTGIDYGYRTYNTKTMVHVDDYEADAHFFSEQEQVQGLTSKNSMGDILATDEEIAVSRDNVSSAIDALQNVIYDMAQATEFGTTSTGDDVSEYTINDNVEQQEAETIKIAKAKRTKKEEKVNVENTL